MSRMRPNELKALQETGPIGETSRASQVIDTDRKCMHCGYQLKGLRVGRNCPECGATTSLPTRMDSPLSVMPLPAILRLKWGSWAVFCCLIGAMVLGAMKGSGRFSDLMIFIGFLALSLSWQFAVRLATPTLDLPQARLWGFHRLGKLRLTAQWLQLGWLLAAGMALLINVIPSSPLTQNVLPIVLRLGMALGVLGLVLLALVFERLAQWTRELEAMNLFNWIVWGLPLGVLSLLWQPSGWWIAILLNLFAIVMMLLYPLAMLMLARGVSLSVYHNIEYEQRRERQSDRKAEFFEKVLEPHLQDANDDPPAPMPDEIQLHDPEKDRSEKT